MYSSHRFVRHRAHRGAAAFTVDVAPLSARSTMASHPLGLALQDE
ncbi:hypothetical protein ACFU98_09335 [Streptomyces sp. NPDC057575]